MFQPGTVKAFSIIAMIFSGMGLIMSIILAFILQGGWSLVYFLSVVSWAILLWASYIGFRLCSYKLYEEEYRKVGIRIYLIIPATVVFVFVVGFIQLILSVVLLATLWALKSNYDDWDNSDVPSGIIEDTTPKD